MSIERITPIDDQFMSRGEMVYHSLYEAILSNQIQVGEHIREGDVARHLGVSRTPVREALQRLSAVGLVQGAGRRGYVIAGVSAEDVIQAYAVRMELEGLCCRLAAPRFTDDGLYRLSALMEQMANALDDHFQCLRIDRGFHQTIYETTGNFVLHKVMRDLMHIVDRFPRAWHQSDERVNALMLDAVVVEHREILEALARRDSESAEAAMRQHMRSGLEGRLAALARPGRCADGSTQVSTHGVADVRGGR